MHTCTARTIRIVVCTILVLLAAALRSQAEDLQRIRTTSRYLQTVLFNATEKSPTLQSIVQRIAASNVIVYLTCERFASSTLSGRTIWAEANREARYLRVQVDCMLPSPQFVAILGHELQHVAEVADTQDVVDSRSFTKLFQAIGYVTCHAAEQFETNGAVKAGERVRQEVLYRWPVGARVVANARIGVPAQ
jgi:hypothetical protein